MLKLKTHSGVQDLFLKQLLGKGGEIYIFTLIIILRMMGNCLLFIWYTVCKSKPNNDMQLLLQGKSSHLHCQIFTQCRVKKRYNSIPYTRNLSLDKISHRNVNKHVKMQNTYQLNELNCRLIWILRTTSDNSNTAKFASHLNKIDVSTSNNLPVAFIRSVGGEGEKGDVSPSPNS